eukprot:TRINITY_DN8119_c0_g1_i3.p1 TRINITY_DN8119_c0_g1~~TRINITY_DN8119_c0_g1_i3.p1  ORF type:complete len:690 (+),score=178.92 TRINITY_DN8119_c0_g1_i3:1304-3373(+)
MPLTPQKVNTCPRIKTADATPKKEGRGRMQVAVRVRPTNEVENPAMSLNVENEYIKCVNKEYSFDSVFTGGQESIYSAYGKPMVEDAVNGYNTCLFAYGQTGSGKTYTLLGLPGAGLPPNAEFCPNAQGLLPRFLENLCRYRQEMIMKFRSLQMHLTMSVLEIYNEDVRDLLKSRDKDAGDTREKGPMLVEDTETKQIVVVGAIEAQVDSSEHAMQLLKMGVNSRETAATQMNEQSSRSHMIVTLTLKQRSSSGNLISNIKFVDLAGSECIGRTGTEGLRRREGSHINKSLLALGKALSSFSTGTQIHEMKGMLRESKLTRLLSENFGGNSRTRMLAMVSPLMSNEQQTQSTLTYAMRAKNITLNAFQNKLKEVEVNKVKQLQQQFAEVTGQLDTTRERLKYVERRSEEYKMLYENLRNTNDELSRAKMQAELERQEAEDARIDFMSLMNSHKENIHTLNARVAQLEGDTNMRQAEVEEKNCEVARLKKELKAEKENSLTCQQQVVQLQKQGLQQTQQLQQLQEIQTKPATAPATALATAPCSPLRPSGKGRAGKSYKRSGSLERSFDCQIKEVTKTTGRLASQLTRAEMAQDYLKEDLQQQQEKSETTEMLRRSAVATTHNLQAQLAGAHKELREEKKKNEVLQALLNKSKNMGPEKKRRMNSSSRVGRSGAPRDTTSSAQSMSSQWG